MLSSALIGCFTVRLISVAHTAERKHRENIYFNTFTFDIRDRTYSVYTMERQYLPHILQDQKLISGAQDL